MDIFLSFFYAGFRLKGVPLRPMTLPGMSSLRFVQNEAGDEVRDASVGFKRHDTLIFPNFKPPPFDSGSVATLLGPEMEHPGEVTFGPDEVLMDESRADRTMTLINEELGEGAIQVPARSNVPDVAEEGNSKMMLDEDIRGQSAAEAAPVVALLNKNTAKENEEWIFAELDDF